MARRKPQRRQPAPKPPAPRFRLRGENRPLFFVAATALAVLWWVEVGAFGASWGRLVLAIVTTFIALGAALRLFAPRLLPALAARRRRRH